MNNTQIKQIVIKRLKLPAFALFVFYIIGSFSLKYFNDLNELQLSMILLFFGLGILFVFALIAHLIANVFCDINNLQSNANDDNT